MATSASSSRPVHRQLDLLALGEPVVDVRAPTRRHRLDDASWVDLCPGFLRGADQLHTELVEQLRWEQRSRILFDQEVVEPRLSGSMHRPGAHPAVTEVAGVLSARYGRRFDTVFCNRYRSGDDAVAWHRDRIHRSQRFPLVAIVVLGASRTFLMRPYGGGSSVRFRPGNGDLLVMGGRSQHEWEHCVPRTARPVGERISVTLRPSIELDGGPG